MGGQVVAAVAVLSRELNEAGDVVSGGYIQATHASSSSYHVGTGVGHRLYLAEHATGGHQGLAHVLEHTASGAEQTVHARSRQGAGHDRVAEHGRGVIASVGVYSGNYTSYGDVVTGIGRDLLGLGDQGSHLFYTRVGENKSERM